MRSAQSADSRGMAARGCFERDAGQTRECEAIARHTGMQTEEGSWTPHGGYNLSGQKRTTFERRFSPLHLRNGPARQCTGYSMKTLAHIDDKCRIELSQMQAVMKSDHEQA